MAEWSKAQISQIQVGNTVASVPGLNLAWDYNIDHSELEINCCYSNSKAPGDLWSLMIWPRLQAPQTSKRQSLSSSKTPIHGVNGEETRKKGKMVTKKPFSIKNRKKL